MNVRRPLLAFASLAICFDVATARAALCPTPTAPEFYAYQSDATTVELVIEDSTLAGIDHYEITRTRINDGSIAPVLPLRISPSTTSITDEGQNLLPGSTYRYTLTVELVTGARTSYLASVVDAGNSVITPLLPANDLLLTPPISPSNDDALFGFDSCRPSRLAWEFFPAPIGRTFAKHFGQARHPTTNATLSCATVLVRDTATGTAPTLFADRYGLFEQPNPVTADLHGRFEFYAENGTYDLEVSGDATYALTGVTVFDPRAAQVMKSEGAYALALVTTESPATADGNIHLALTRPNSTDINNKGHFRPKNYRLLANQSVNAWAMTYNLGVDEQTGALQSDDDTEPSFFLRVNRPTSALEFGIDTRRIVPHAPAPEVLMHVGADRAHMKSFMGPVGMEAPAAQTGTMAGDVVVIQSDGTAKRTTGKQFHPWVVLAVDEPDGVSGIGSRLYLAIGGRTIANVFGDVTAGDLLVSRKDGTAKAQQNETDSRYVVGYSLETATGNFAKALYVVAR